MKVKNRSGATKENGLGFEQVVAAVDNVFGNISQASSRYRSGRSNLTSTKDGEGMLGELNNINSGVTPFKEGDGCIDVCDAITLSQKAYWNVAIYRMTIDIMTEFCNSKIHWRGGSTKARKFYKAWFKKIKGQSLGEQFFREWFRSGNVFLYKLLGQIRVNNGIDLPMRVKLPLRYLLLNPADIKCNDAASFVDAEYSKLINDYERKRLKNPVTEQEKEFFNTLSPETQEALRKGSQPLITLKPENLKAIFCKKQDYEPLAVPLFFPVLFDINLKLQFKKVEQVIAKTIDYAILLITHGAKPEDGGVNQNITNTLQELFQTESVGRVLVSDYTTKADFILPDLKKILGPEKYKIVNEDISNGMLNIFFGEDKFANSMVKINIFMERLREAREAFLNEFLIPEMEEVASSLSFRESSIPTPEFEQVDLKDEVQYFRLYNRLAEMGFLTPEETFEAYRSNKLPLAEDSVDNQQKFLEQKEQGLYDPVIGGGKEAGRPKGTKAPQSTKNVVPIGASRQFDFDRVKNLSTLMDDLNSKVESQYKKENKVKRMSKNHKAKAFEITKTIVENNKPEDWDRAIQPFFKGEMMVDASLASLMSEIEEEHKVSDLACAFLAHSVIEECN